MFAAGLRKDKIHLCGLSLGAQLVGNIARVIPVPLLIALDPAGPGFYLTIPRFKRGFAKFTIEIHSDVGVYGTPYLNGDLNILPHDGHRVQPGCPTEAVPFGQSHDGETTYLTLLFFTCFSSSSSSFKELFRFFSRGM